jgi:hypothetical protein
VIVVDARHTESSMSEIVKVNRLRRKKVYTAAAISPSG